MSGIRGSIGHIVMINITVFSTTLLNASSTKFMFPVPFMSATGQEEIRVNFISSDEVEKKLRKRSISQQKRSKDRLKRANKKLALKRAGVVSRDKTQAKSSSSNFRSRPLLSAQFASVKSNRSRVIVGHAGRVASSEFNDSDIQLCERKAGIEERRPRPSSSTTTNSDETKSRRKSEFYEKMRTFNENALRIEKQDDSAVKVDEMYSGCEAFGSLTADLLHPHLIQNVTERLGFDEMTLVQQKSIPIVHGGRDVLIKSQTGSGKTLCYALPIVDRLHRISPTITRSDGVFALIICPTRELALQNYSTFASLVHSFVHIVPGVLLGGEKRKTEKARLRRGANILVATPGRILDHLELTEALSLQQVRYVVVDEADRILELGFEEKLQRVFDRVRKAAHKFQTVLVSATITDGVQKLADKTLTNESTLIDIDGRKSLFQLPASLEQFYCVIPAKLRLVFLAAFLLNQLKYGEMEKMLVFVSSRAIAELYYQVFAAVLGSVDDDSDSAKRDENKSQGMVFYRLYGDMTQNERNGVFRLFAGCTTRPAVMFATDVAARGLDFKCVDWVVQMSIPETPQVYIHRVGRTARAGASGRSLLVLMTHEDKYLSFLSDMIQSEPRKLDSFDIFRSLIKFKGNTAANKGDCDFAVASMQNELDTVIEADFKDEALRAYKSFVKSYATYKTVLKKFLNIHELHLGHIATSFGLREAPSELKQMFPASNTAAASTDDRKMKRPKKKEMFRTFVNGVPNDRPAYNTSSKKPLVGDSKRAGVDLPTNSVYASKSNHRTMKPFARKSLAGRSERKLQVKRGKDEQRAKILPLSKRYSEMKTIDF